MKRVFAFVLTFIMVFSAMSCFAETSNNEIKLLLDEKEIAFDQGPTVISGELMIPLRAVFEAAGMVVNWDNDTETVAVFSGGDLILIQIDNKKMFKGTEAFEVETAAVLLNDRTLISTQALKTVIDCELEWNEEENLITVTTIKDKAENTEVETEK